MLKRFCILLVLTLGLQISSKNLRAAASDTLDVELAALDTQKIVGDISLGRFDEINRLSKSQLSEMYEKENAQRIRLLMCKKCLQVFTNALATVNEAGGETVQTLAQELDRLVLLCFSYINEGGKSEYIVDSAGQEINFNTLMDQLLSGMDKSSAEYRRHRLRLGQLTRLWLTRDQPGEITGFWSADGN